MKKHQKLKSTNTYRCKVEVTAQPILRQAKTMYQLEF